MQKFCQRLYIQPLKFTLSKRFAFTQKTLHSATIICSPAKVLHSQKTLRSLNFAFAEKCCIPSQKCVLLQREHLFPQETFTAKNVFACKCFAFPKEFEFAQKKSVFSNKRFVLPKKMFSLRKVCFHNKFCIQSQKVAFSHKSFALPEKCHIRSQFFFFLSPITMSFRGSIDSSSVWKAFRCLSVLNIYIYIHIHTHIIYIMCPFT